MVSRKRQVSLIDEAIKNLKEHGWSQGEYQQPDGSLCALGALGFRNHDGATEAQYAVVAKLTKVVADRPYYYEKAVITDWNDEYGRTEKEVIGAFRTLRRQLVKLMKG